MKIPYERPLISIEDLKLSQFVPGRSGMGNCKVTFI